uniref:Uncharacterized protein n=1 Tax=Chrysotila carterae TaxID=13221 RepID=A0A7S4BCY6_CHRCT
MPPPTAAAHYQLVATPSVDHPCRPPPAFRPFPRFHSFNLSTMFISMEMLSPMLVLCVAAVPLGVCVSPSAYVPQSIAQASPFCACCPPLSEQADNPVAAAMLRTVEAWCSNTLGAGKMSEGDVADLLNQLKALSQSPGHHAPAPSFPALQCSSSLADSSSCLSFNSALSTEASGTTATTDSTDSTFIADTDSTFNGDTGTPNESDFLSCPDDGPVIYRSLPVCTEARALAAAPETGDGAKRAKAGNQASQATAVADEQLMRSQHSPIVFRSMQIASGTQYGARATAKGAETATAAATAAAMAPRAAPVAAMRPPTTLVHGNGESPAILAAVHALHLMLKPLSLSAPDLQRISTVVCRIARSCASLELSESGREWLSGLPSDAPLTPAEKAQPLASALEAAHMLSHAAEGRAVRRGMRAHACSASATDAPSKAAHAENRRGAVQATAAKQHTQCAFYFDYGDKPPDGRQRYVVIQLVFDCSYESYLADFNRGKNWRENTALSRVESMHVVETRSSRALWEVAALEMKARNGGDSALVTPAGTGTSRCDGDADDGEGEDAHGASDDDDGGADHDDGEGCVNEDADASMEPPPEQFCQWSWDHARLEQWSARADSGPADGHAPTTTAISRDAVIGTARKALARCADMTPLRHDEVRG